MQELGDVDIGGKFTAGVADISEQHSGAVVTFSRENLRKVKKEN